MKIQNKISARTITFSKHSTDMPAITVRTLQLLGSGAYGKVYIAENIEDRS